MGHGAWVNLSYRSWVFILAAVMYVDDTDLLHWPASYSTDLDKLLVHVQQETMDWTNHSQASGGILKDKKCSV